MERTRKTKMREENRDMDEMSKEEEEKERALRDTKQKS